MKQMALILCILVTIFLSAQENQGEEKKQEGLPEQITAAEDMVFPGEFLYKPEGRRDPFISMLSQGKTRNRHSMGVEGLMIDELNVKGIIKTPSGRQVLVIGPDGKPYNLKVGDKVYDGEVLSITANAVEFKKTATILIPGQKEKIITKRLNPEKEEF